MGVVVLVLSIVGAVGVVQAAIWIPLVRRWRKRRASYMDELHAEMLSAGERFVIEPQSAVYRGATGPYGAVKGNGSIMLTDRRLLFRKLTGGMVEVPVAAIIGTHEAKSFNGSRVGGSTHLVVDTNAPGAVAFFVNDRAQWAAALAAAMVR